MSVSRIETAESRDETMAGSAETADLLTLCLTRKARQDKPVAPDILGVGGLSTQAHNHHQARRIPTRPGALFEPTLLLEPGGTL